MDEELKKLIIQLMEGQEEMRIDLKSVKAGQEDLKKEVQKNGIAIESIQKDVKQLAEIQQSHYEENQRNHEQIVEILTVRLDNQDKAIKNISVVK